jgi:hypothetical protein
VNKFASNFGLLPVATGNSATGRKFDFRFLVLLVLLLAGGSGRSAYASNAPVASIGPGPQVAISDFDGDRNPDTASIQAGPNVPGRTDYWIQLRLSATGQQFIRLAGPAGGLQIEARDVNGDHAIDLVVTTAWFRQPVAVLLNDGHGSFSRVEPDGFPEAFRESTTNCFSNFNLATDAVGVPPQKDAGICRETGAQSRLRSNAGSILPLRAGFLRSPLLISHAGRAPPSEVPYL